jgi:hypothetical protein
MCLWIMRVATSVCTACNHSHTQTHTHYTHTQYSSLAQVHIYCHMLYMGIRARMATPDHAGETSVNNASGQKHKTSQNQHNSSLQQKQRQQQNSSNIKLKQQKQQQQQQLQYLSAASAPDSRTTAPEPQHKTAAAATSAQKQQHHSRSNRSSSSNSSCNTCQQQLLQVVEQPRLDRNNGCEIDKQLTTTQAHGLHIVPSAASALNASKLGHSRLAQSLMKAHI